MLIMRIHYRKYQKLPILLLALDGTVVAAQTWSPIIVKKITELGHQSTPDVTAVSRDGGYSTIINGNIVWLYDDTECLDLDGRQHSFVSNTAAYAYQGDQNISTVKDFGVVEAGEDQEGRKVLAILADTAVGSGGWIPFQHDELEFNEKNKGEQRIAICKELRIPEKLENKLTMLLPGPGTSPTPISTTEAFLFAPLIHVDFKPQDPAKEYQARGMTVITIKAPSSGPTATRQGDLVIPGTEVAYGGFSSIVGIPNTKGFEGLDSDKRDVYLLGTTQSGLQLARVGLADISAFGKYTFFDPRRGKFSKTPPPLDVSDPKDVYLPGNFSTGSVFYSPYFRTFIMIYFSQVVDSTFYIRYLSLEEPLVDDEVWARGGKHGKGIDADDAKALIKYAWSPEQKLYASPPGKGGFNYAGMAHPEYFNRQYFAKSAYPKSTSDKERRNDWYGSDLIPESDGKADGKCVLLSWTSHLYGGRDAGVYEIQLAMVEFDDIPIRPADEDVVTATKSDGSAPTTSGSASEDNRHHQADHRYDGLPKGYRGDSEALSSFWGPATAKKRFGEWDVVWKAMIWLGIVAAGALVL